MLARQAHPAISLNPARAGALALLAGVGPEYAMSTSMRRSDSAIPWKLFCKKLGRIAALGFISILLTTHNPHVMQFARAQLDNGSVVIVARGPILGGDFDRLGAFIQAQLRQFDR
jgi:hypothetical protein